jgi:hypothetical protein
VVLAGGGIHSLSSVLGTLEMALNGACSSSGPKSPERAAVTRGSAGSHRRQRVRRGRSPVSGIAWFDYPVTACLQDLPFTSVPSFARSF